jgi:hypothetical protein
MKYRDSLDVVAKTLIERETLDGRDVDELVKHGRLLSDEERTALDPIGEPTPVATPVATADVPAGSASERSGDA